jgi:hypothetical protein
MKPQDTVFILIFIFLVFKNFKWSLTAGLACVALSIPLFALRIFFTAERLVEYGFASFLLSIILNLISFKKIK